MTIVVCDGWVYLKHARDATGVFKTEQFLEREMQKKCIAIPARDATRLYRLTDNCSM